MYLFYARTIVWYSDVWGQVEPPESGSTVISLEDEEKIKEPTGVGS